MPRLSHQYLRISIITMVMVGILVSRPLLTQAVDLVNPSAPPPAGQSAKPLSTADINQQKLGSLVIGVQGTGCTGADTSQCKSLCLNGAAGSACIKRWSDLSSAISGAYLKLIAGGFDNSAIQNQTLPTSPTDLTPNAGYVRLKGSNGQARPYTVNLAPSSTNGSSALYADAMRSDNYAGYFIGRLAINNGATTGKLCLNSIDNYTGPSQGGHYCISQWSDIQSSALSDNLTLRGSPPAASSESGNVFLGQSFGAGSIVIGEPDAVNTATLSANQQCGDGFCSASETKNTNCPIDCASITGPANWFTALSSVNGEVSLSFNTRNDPSSETKVRILIVRSDQPNFFFNPVDGVVYPTGGNSQFAVVVSDGTYLETNSYSVTDNVNGITAGTRYYYRAYQANMYPRYSSEATASLTANGSGDNCPLCEQIQTIRLRP